VTSFRRFTLISGGDEIGGDVRVTFGAGLAPELNPDQIPAPPTLLEPTRVNPRITCLNLALFVARVHVLGRALPAHEQGRVFLL